MAQKLAFPIQNFKIQAGYHNEAKTPKEKWQNCVLYKTLNKPGEVWASAGHFGMDMTGMYRAFYASGNGKVIGFNKNAANTVGRWLAVKYFDVDGYGDLIVRYFHLDKINVVVGQNVTAQTIIADYGNTGTKSTGAHLHVEVDTDTRFWNYTPTLKSANGGLCAGARGKNDTTQNPAYVFKIKVSGAVKQTVQYPPTGWYSGPKPLATF